MRQHIARLRLKPNTHKKRVALVTSLGMTVVIVFFWVATFSLRHVDDKTVVRDETSPLRIITQNLGSAFNSIKEGKDALKNLTTGKTTVEVTGNSEENVNYTQGINY